MSVSSPPIEAAQVARKSGSNFYLSFFSLPREKREAMTAVYAFCREVDDAVDDPRVENPSEKIAWWPSEIAQTYAGKPSLPMTHTLLKAVERFDLTRDYFDGILTGMEMDLTMKRYPTWAALEKYCYHVAGEVGLLCMEIFGYRSERLQQYAVKLGTAFQLTNILRDVGVDAQQGRIYLPQEDLARFGVAEGWIIRSTAGLPMGALGSEGFKNFQNLMSFEASRAHGYYRDAAVLPLPEERPSIRAAVIMSAVYGNILDRIKQQGYNVFGSRVRVPTPVKLWLAAKAYWDCR